MRLATTHPLDTEQQNGNCHIVQTPPLILSIHTELSLLFLDTLLQHSIIPVEFVGVCVCVCVYSPVVGGGELVEGAVVVGARTREGGAGFVPGQRARVVRCGETESAGAL